MKRAILTTALLLALPVGVAAQSAPDLEVAFAEVDDSTPVEGGRFKLWVTVGNFGDADSAATTLRYYQSTDATISSTDTQVGTVEVEAVETDRISRESIELTAPSTAGTYYYGACVDAVAGESDTTDNCTRRSVTAIRDTSPQARHHFTQADQVNQLVGASEADPDLGFMARLLALCSLPRTNPGNQLQYKRVNGPYKLVMIAGADNKLPYGSLPRLLLAWVSTEAVRTQSRVLVLGKSLSAFMRALGINTASGGPRGEQTRLRNQMDRLFHASVQLIYQDEHGEQFIASHIADRGEFWWNPKRPDEGTLWESKIRLGEDFFNEIISHPVPLDMNTLTALKRCALGLDLYLWLVYRTFPLRAPQRITWRQVYRQFGVEPSRASDNDTVQKFRRKILRELKKIKLAWPEVNYTTARGVLILLPSTPAIAPLNPGQPGS